MYELEIKIINLYILFFHKAVVYKKYKTTKKKKIFYPNTFPAKNNHHQIMSNYVKWFVI